MILNLLFFSFLFFILQLEVYMRITVIIPVCIDIKAKAPIQLLFIFTIMISAFKETQLKSVASFLNKPQSVNFQMPVMRTFIANEIKLRKYTLLVDTESYAIFQIRYIVWFVGPGL